MTYPQRLLHPLILILVAIVLSACVLPSNIPIAAPPAAPEIELLFAYSSTCSGCTYEKPIIAEFAQKHPEVNVTSVEYSQLTPAQKQLVAGTNGNPTMVFYKGNTIRQISGQTAGMMFEREFEVFQEQLSRPMSSKITINNGGT